MVGWSRFCYDVDKFLSFLDVLIPDFYVYSRGRPPKHSPREYLKASLRDADVFISIYFLGYRDVIEGLVKHIGNILDDEVGYEYSVNDST